MLSKLFYRPTKLQVGGQLLTFYSIADFEFSLNGRTTLPVKKITELVKQSPHLLHKEAATIKEIEKKFVAILSQSIENPQSINQALRELDNTVFSQDHGWRSLMAALNTGGDELNPYRRVALVKYMQYLASRQEIIKYLYSDKQAAPRVNPPALETPQDQQTDKLSGTLILDGPMVETLTGMAGDTLERLPKGEAISINMEKNRNIDMRLSKHKCKLSAKNGIEFIDQGGKHHPLKPGKNVIGRDLNSTIKVDAELRDVSRLHLLIENLGDNVVRLTDMSSHGTFLPPVLFMEQRL